ncbi:MAG: TRAP transporter large permease subunit, partial [Elioraea tepidiphila]
MAGTMLAIMLVLFALSVPVAVAIGLAAIAGIEFFTRFPLIVAAQQIYVALDRFPLAAIPFFILAGNLMEVGGISRRLVEFARAGRQIAGEHVDREGNADCRIAENHPAIGVCQPGLGQ